MPESPQLQRAPQRPRASSDAKLRLSTRPRSHSNIETFSPVNNDGCFEFDRVIKSGYVERRTQKTKKWKSIYLVLRPNTLSIYKTDKEDKLRHQIYLSDLTAVAFLKDPKHKRQNVFGLFSPSRNFHFQAPTPRDAQEWVDTIRRDARIEEEDDEMFVGSPILRRQSGGLSAIPFSTSMDRIDEHERFLSSSPEPSTTKPASNFPGAAPGAVPRKSSMVESSGWSGNELGSHSDFSDNDVAPVPVSVTIPVPAPGLGTAPGIRSASQTSVVAANLEQDPDRVIWQGYLWFLRSKRGVRQWKHLWAVLRPRNLILYKDESEYTAQWILALGSVVNVVDIDPLSRSKTNCLQVITEEKSYRFCAHDEESLVRCIGAFKSLLAKRRELEARAVGASS